MNINVRSIGRRKSSISKVELIPGSSKIVINGISAEKYLQNNPIYLFNIKKPLQVLGLIEKYQIYAQVYGGGLSAQSLSIQLAVARSLSRINKSYQIFLKSKKLLTCDSRCKERKKYGLKKARKAPQYSKR